MLLHPTNTKEMYQTISTTPWTKYKAQFISYYEFLNTPNNKSKDCIELLKLLIKSGAKIDVQNADGNTALLKGLKA